MDYKNKYLIYKKKYLFLKKQLIGGTRFRSIPNSGGGEPGLANQCMWISIRDYINYHRGIVTTVIELKRRLGLSLDTNTIEYDDDNPILRNALERLAVGLRITLCFIYTKRDGSIAPFCLNQDGTMRPFRTINPGNNDIVYVATFGRHFELIVDGPNYQLERHHNSTIREVNPYQPKVRVNNNYVLPSQVSDYEDKQIVQASINLVEINQNIDYFENQLKELRKNINDNQDGLRNINSLDLDDEEKMILVISYEQMIRDGNNTIDKIRSKLELLRQEKATLELIIN